MDAPATAKVVYTGSLEIEIEAGEILFSGTYMNGFGRMRVRDETEAANAVLGGLIPDPDGLETARMVAH